MSMRDLIKIFKALSDRNRLRILKMLEIKPLCVCEITEVLQLAASTVSKHLSLLRDVNLIMDEKEGKWVIYRLNQTDTDEQIKKLLPQLSTWLSTDPTILKDLEKVKTVVPSSET